MQKLHNDYPVAPDKIEIKRSILSEYQLKTADLYNIPIGNVKKLVPNLIKKSMCFIMKTLLETRIKTKKNTSRIRIQSIKMGKTIY